MGWEVQAEVSGEDVLFSDQPNMKDTWENVVAAMRLKMYLPMYKDKGSIEKKPLLLHRAFQHGRHSNTGGPMLTLARIGIKGACPTRRLSHTRNTSENALAHLHTIDHFPQLIQDTA